MNGWAIVIASLRDFAAFASFAQQKFNRPFPPGALTPKLQLARFHSHRILAG